MKKIYKYQLEWNDRQELLLPLDATILSVAIQNQVLCVWAIVDPDAEPEPRVFYIAGTGHEPPPPEKKAVFVGTVHWLEKGLVFHVFRNKHIKDALGK
jgi:hypothetical protein